MKAAFIGFGVLGQQILAFVNELERPGETLFFDDFVFANKSENARPFNEYALDKYSDFSFYVCLGYKHLPLKDKIIKELLAKNRDVPAMVHPTVYVSPLSKIGAGSFIYPCCNVDMHVEIGEGVQLHNSVVVSHNSVIGSCCYISPGTVLSGNVTVGQYAFIGTGSVISNHVSIGDGCAIGVGSVLTKSLEAGLHGIGNPFRILEQKLKLD